MYLDGYWKSNIHREENGQGTKDGEFGRTGKLKIFRQLEGEATDRNYQLVSHFHYDRSFQESAGATE